MLNWKKEICILVPQLGADVGVKLRFLNDFIVIFFFSEVSYIKN